jgi:hypothetical protein
MNKSNPRILSGKTLWMGLMLFLLPVFALFAQEVTEPVELTEADWTKFATVEVMTAELLAKKTKELKTWVRNKEGLGGGARFNEIKAVWGNVEKEASINLTEVERTAYKECLVQQASLQREVIAYQADLIRDEKLLGMTLYLQIATLVEEDPTQKEKLDQEIRRLKKKKKR